MKSEKLTPVLIKFCLQIEGSCNIMWLHSTEGLRFKCDLVGFRFYTEILFPYFLSH